MELNQKINWITVLTITYVLFISCSIKPEESPVINPHIESKPQPGDGAPVEVWHKGYGTDDGEHIHEVMETSDGGFIGIGQVAEAAEKASDILVVKIDKEGAFLWQRIIGTKGNFDVGICVDEVSDGYLIGGGKYEGSQQRYLAKLGFDGLTKWQQTYHYQGHGMIRGIAIDESENILLTGYKNFADAGFTFIADDSEGFVMKVRNNDGSVIWEKGISSAQGAKIRKDRSGFVICTTHWMNDPVHPQDMYLIKLDPEGNELWAKHYGGDSDEHCYDCDVTSDGGYILGGHTRSPSYGVVNWDYLIMKIDAEGNQEWHRTFGQPRGYDARYIHDEAYGVRQTLDGGYVIVGGTGDEHSYSASGHPRGASDIWMVYAVKVDAQGETVWQQVYGSPILNDAGEYMGLTSDGGFIIGTDTDFAGKQNFEPNNFGFLKIK
jgi:hypothetical protein